MWHIRLVFLWEIGDIYEGERKSRNGVRSEFLQPILLHNCPVQDIVSELFSGIKDVWIKPSGSLQSSNDSNWKFVSIDQQLWNCDLEYCDKIIAFKLQLGVLICYLGKRVMSHSKMLKKKKKGNKTHLSVITLSCSRLNFFPGSVKNYRVNFDYTVNGVQN